MKNKVFVINDQLVITAKYKWVGLLTKENSEFGGLVVVFYSHEDGVEEDKSDDGPVEGVALDQLLDEVTHLLLLSLVLRATAFAPSPSRPASSGRVVMIARERVVWNDTTYSTSRTEENVNSNIGSIYENCWPNVKKLSAVD